MTSLSLHRDGVRGFGKGGAEPLPRAIRKVRNAFRKIHVAIAAAKIRRLRNELMLRGGHVGAPSIAPGPIRRSQMLRNRCDF